MNSRRNNYTLSVLNGFWVTLECCNDDHITIISLIKYNYDYLQLLFSIKCDDAFYSFSLDLLLANLDILLNLYKYKDNNELDIQYHYHAQTIC